MEKHLGFMARHFGLIGVDGDGSIYAPGGRRVARLPFRIAVAIQNAWNAAL